MNRRHLIALLPVIGLTLSAGMCKTAEPVIIKEYIEVPTPVAVQPITPAQVPDKPEPLGPRPETGADLMLAAWACDLWAYVLRADPLLMVSSGQEQRELGAVALCEGD